MGTAEAELLLDNIAILHKFHIVSEEFPVPGDGILGLDFLKIYNCLIDYGPKGDYLFIRPDNFPEQLAVKIRESVSENSLSLPARAEVIRKIHVSSTEDELLIPNQELHPGIHVARTILTKNNPYVRILNTTFQNQTVVNPNLITESLRNYNIYNWQDRHIVWRIIFHLV